MAATGWRVLLLGVLAMAASAQSPTQIGFNSIDCGLGGDSNYTEISYSPDEAYIDTGVNRRVSPATNLSGIGTYYADLWSFPDGVRNCYALRPVESGGKYLVRADFLYGNYDGLDRPRPSTSTWALISLAPSCIQVCLVDTGGGTPFVSMLELRPLLYSMYPMANQSQSLLLLGNRENYGWGSIIRNLSHSGLSGGIPPLISNLTALQSLGIPANLEKLPALSFLNLASNNLTGPLPPILYEKSQNGSISLSTVNICETREQKRKNIVPIAIAISAALAVAFVILIIVCKVKRRKANDSPSKTQGSYGKKDGEENSLHHERAKEFRAEAELLTRVHHKNLVSLLGYCYDNLSLVYEFIAKGSLADHLSGDKGSIDNLCWRERLRIATEAAQAKLSDFELSRAFPNEGLTHTSTAVAGTPGYLDLEYYQTYRLNEKSDLYSFGIVLLELLTGEQPITVGSNAEKTHIVQRVQAVGIAMSCTSPESNSRPTMSDVVVQLKECMSTEESTGQSSDVDTNEMNRLPVHMGPWTGHLRDNIARGRGHEIFLGGA
ncbi:unnamed protein product [Spirodela intermedia]|uniref:Protein kinase domain-containing protein n=1 Tax=Spirodela intermedia TaxID=51605 RepID=A0A7I8LJ43_SPIIN|nr:unnamed protein product [Spirodela intermedia]